MNINQLIKKKFSLIPLQKDSKLPIIRWKKYQYKRAENEEIFSWYSKYGTDINIGIVCEISKIGVIDADDKRQLPELTKLVPEIWETTRVSTSRPGHLQFYFSTFGHTLQSTNRLFGLDGIEFRSKGRYVVAVGSVVSGVRYEYEKSLTHILPVTKTIIDRCKMTGVPITDITGDITPKVRALCVGQILNYNLPIGKRKLAYHIAYSKMRQEGHLKSYAISLCKLANRNLDRPLKDNEFDFGKIYHYGCPLINKELSFINCSFCQVRGGLKVQSLQMSNIHKLFSLTNSERGILSLLDTYYKGEDTPAINEIQKKTGMNFYTVRDALKGLREKGII